MSPCRFPMQREPTASDSYHSNNSLTTSPTMEQAAVKMEQGSEEDEMPMNLAENNHRLDSPLSSTTDQEGYTGTESPDSASSPRDQSDVNNNQTFRSIPSRLHAQDTQCKICGKRLSNMSCLRVHQRIHTGEKPFRCSICGRKFAQLGHLNNHKITHTGEKPHICLICNKRFTQKSTMQVHMTTHTGQKKFKCDICQKRLISSGALNVHRRVHTGERPYVCKICGESYIQANGLSSHMLKHEGIQPYQCKKCFRSFKYHRSMTLHMQSCSGGNGRFPLDGVKEEEELDLMVESNSRKSQREFENKLKVDREIKKSSRTDNDDLDIVVKKETPTNTIQEQFTNSKTMYNTPSESFQQNTQYIRPVGYNGTNPTSVVNDPTRQGHISQRDFVNHYKQGNLATQGLSRMPQSLMSPADNQPHYINSSAQLNREQLNGYAEHSGIIHHNHKSVNYTTIKAEPTSPYRNNHGYRNQSVSPNSVRPEHGYPPAFRPAEPARYGHTPLAFTTQARINNAKELFSYYENAKQNHGMMYRDDNAKIENASTTIPIRRSEQQAVDGQYNRHPQANYSPMKSVDRHVSPIHAMHPPPLQRISPPVQQRLPLNDLQGMVVPLEMTPANYRPRTTESPVMSEEEFLLRRNFMEQQKRRQDMYLKSISQRPGNHPSTQTLPTESRCANQDNSVPRFPSQSKTYNKNNHIIQELSRSNNDIQRPPTLAHIMSPPRVQSNPQNVPVSSPKQIVAHQYRSPTNIRSPTPSVTSQNSDKSEVLDLTAPKTKPVEVKIEEDNQCIDLSKPKKSDDPLDLSWSAKSRSSSPTRKEAEIVDIQNRSQVTGISLQPPTDAINYFNSTCMATSYRHKIMVKSGNTNPPSLQLPTQIRHQSPVPLNMVCNPTSVVKQEETVKEQSPSRNNGVCMIKNNQFVSEPPNLVANTSLASSHQYNIPSRESQPFNSTPHRPLINIPQQNEKDQLLDFSKNPSYKHDMTKNNVSIVNPINYKRSQSPIKMQEDIKEEKDSLDKPENPLLDNSYEGETMTALNMIHKVIETKLAEDTSSSESESEYEPSLKRRRSNSESDCTVIMDDLGTESSEVPSDKETPSKQSETLLNQLLAKESEYLKYKQNDLLGRENNTDLANDSVNPKLETSDSQCSNNKEISQMEVCSDSNKNLSASTSHNTSSKSGVDDNMPLDFSDNHQLNSNDTNLKATIVQSEGDTNEPVKNDSSQDNVQFTHIDDAECVLEVRCELDHELCQSQEEKERMLKELGLTVNCNIENKNMDTKQVTKCDEQNEPIQGLTKTDLSQGDVKTLSSDISTLCELNYLDQNQSKGTLVKYSCRTCDAVFCSLKQFLEHASGARDKDKNVNKEKLSPKNSSTIVGH